AAVLLQRARLGDVRHRRPRPARAPRHARAGRRGRVLRGRRGRAGGRAQPRARVHRVAAGVLLGGRRVILAVDVGGTKLAAARVSPDGTVLEVRRSATPQDADAETLWQALLAVIAPLSGGVTGVGVGCGGPMTWPSGVVSPLNIPGWRGFPLRSRLCALFPGVPVRVHNDAICLAVAEHWRGAGRGVADMLGMVVSTGVGGGLILGGRLVNGG